jgi:holo-[acyl-carrier protein] synthase
VTVVGLGLDIVDVTGFTQQLADEASGFVGATYRAGERRRAPDDPATRILHLAGRFAAKEAFVKAWSSARRGKPPAVHDLDLRDIEVVADEYGRPALRLHGPVREALANLTDTEAGVRPTVHLSITHDGPIAAAVVVIEQIEATQHTGQHGGP